jgi:hypothetical protein
MDEARAVSIVSALANGVNPATGEIFPADSPYQTADVVRALFLVTRLLEAKAAKTRERPATAGNAGKPWNSDEDQKLLREFDRGVGIADLAHAHGRTPAGIQARLEKHGRLEVAEEGANSRRWRSGSAVPASR